MPPLKSAEFHRLARQELGPTMVSLGFERTPSTSSASWVRPEGGRWLVCWLQPSRSGGEVADAFEFTIELRLSTRPETGGDGSRKRLPALLSEAELGTLRRQRHTITHGADDVWFRQADETDARALMRFLARALPGAINRFLA